jgi:hypothetical protein
VGPKSEYPRSELKLLAKYLMGVGGLAGEVLPGWTPQRPTPGMRPGRTTTQVQAIRVRPAALSRTNHGREARGQELSKACYAGERKTGPGVTTLPASTRSLRMG